MNVVWALLPFAFSMRQAPAMVQRQKSITSIKVVGIFLERTGATVLLADAKHSVEDAGNGLEPWDLAFGDSRVIRWNPSNMAMVEAGLEKLRAILVNLRDHVQCAGISCYGPFESLAIPSQDLANRGFTYGRIREDTAHPPLNGLNLHELLLTGLGPEWHANPENRAVIQTDAGACALGEAYFRSTRMDHTLACLCVTQGIGLGIVKGREILNAALHPEVGLLPAFPRDGDPIAPMIVDNQPQKSIAELACNGALRRRYRHFFPERKGTFSEIMELKSRHFDKEFWRHRAFYVAQACIACTFIIPPNEIVISAQIDPLNAIDGQARFFLREQLETMQSQGQPVFDYSVLRTKDFISKPVPTNETGLPEGLPATGSAGLCYAAAAASVDHEAE